MYKQVFILFAAVLLCMNKAVAQNNGILPLTGLRYFKEGISAKAILVKMDGSQLLNNRIPFNKEIEISLQQPSGFTADKNKTVYAAAELSILSSKGELLLKTPNLFLSNETTGFTVKKFITPSMKFVITPDVLRANLNCIIKIRLYDLKGKNQLRLELPVVVARAGELIRLSNTITAIKSPAGSTAVITGLKAGKMLFYVDTTIKVDRKMAYASIYISDINGTSIGGIFDGKENFWVYDKDFNEIPITDILLKDVGGAMENNTVSYTLKIPFRLKTAPVKGYVVRFRWESPDRTQVIDVVVTI